MLVYLFHLKNIGGGGGEFGDPSQAVYRFWLPLSISKVTFSRTRYWTRLCAPLSICGSVTSSLQNFLAETVNLLLAYRRSNSAKWRDTEKLGFKNLCLVFKSVLLPYIQQCLSALFPPNYLSEVCGFSSSDLQSRKLGFIIQAKICLPILDFMPEEPGKLLKWFS